MKPKLQCDLKSGRQIDRHMHQNQKVIQFLLGNGTQFVCHLSIWVVCRVANFSNLGISGILSIGSGPIQPGF
jgi:hypothetical protein